MDTEPSREFACGYVVTADHEVELGPMRGVQVATAFGQPYLAELANFVDRIRLRGVGRRGGGPKGWGPEGVGGRSRRGFTRQPESPNTQI